MRRYKYKRNEIPIADLESDLQRMQEEMNFRLFLETDGYGSMLWVEKIEISGFVRSSREQGSRKLSDRKPGIIRNFIKRLVNSLAGRRSG